MHILICYVLHVLIKVLARDKKAYLKMVLLVLDTGFFLYLQIKPCISGTIKHLILCIKKILALRVIIMVIVIYGMFLKKVVLMI